jgi:predicted phosphoribosyltransferase
MLFRNRFDAGSQLAVKLEKYRNTDAIVLALPRGGVPVAYEIAVSLGLPLEVSLSKKIGHPANKEYAIGSVSLNDIFLNASVVVPEEYVKNEVEKIRKVLQERLHQYMGDKTPANLSGKNVILVDDGLATGSTMVAAIHSVRKENPAKVIVAAPVSPKDTAGRIDKLADEFVCIDIPEYFYGVGQFYMDFHQLDDAEVEDLLKKAELARK